MGWTLAIPFLPAAAFLLTLCLPRTVRNKMVLLPVSFIVIAAVLALVGLFQVFPGGHIGEEIWATTWTLATIGTHALQLTLSLDSLAMLMLVMVTIVGACVQIYSLFYMHDDERKGWFFTVVSLFTSAMLFLVMSGNLLLTFVMWEIMGLCSYLLIGFWFQDEAPRKASQKAFLVTRAGDIGFFLAMGAIYVACQTFDLNTILATAGTWSKPTLLIVSLGMIWAAMGKSAQFPLLVWLPDAMAGPTPSSALIHAATMVAAGVFVLARLLPVLALSTLALNVMLWVGIVTALLGGILACFQNDIKKMLAYSTISQLGLMFVGLGCNAAVPTLFHLNTHAFFKSLLFLTAGIIIHATHTQDMRKMGGLARKMPITTVIFSVGAFSLAGLVPLSGFFSKDEVFAAIQRSGNTVVFALALVMGFLTALYVGKAWFTVFFGKPRTKGAHEACALELVPTGILAAITLFLGFLSPLFARYIGHEGAWPEAGLAATSTVITLAGAFIGYLMYSGKINTERIAEKMPFLARVAEQNLYFDYFYQKVIINPYFALSRGLWWFDDHVIDGVVNGVTGGYKMLARGTSYFDRHVIDGVVNGVTGGYKMLARGTSYFDRHGIDGVVNGLASLSEKTGNLFRRLQSGKVLNYQRLVVAAIVVMLFVVVVLKGA